MARVHSLKTSATKMAAVFFAGFSEITSGWGNVAVSEAAFI